MFFRALCDAIYITNNFHNYAKGFFLKGEISMLLKDFEEAEKSFLQVLQKERSVEAEEKLFESKMKQILQRGYDVDVARKAIRLSANAEVSS